MVLNYSILHKVRGNRCGKLTEYYRGERDEEDATLNLRQWAADFLGKYRWVPLVAVLVTGCALATTLILHASLVLEAGAAAALALAAYLVGLLRASFQERPLAISCPPAPAAVSRRLGLTRHFGKAGHRGNSGWRERSGRSESAGAGVSWRAGLRSSKSAAAWGG